MRRMDARNQRLTKGMLNLNVLICAFQDHVQVVTFLIRAYFDHLVSPSVWNCWHSMEVLICLVLRLWPKHLHLSLLKLSSNLNEYAPNECIVKTGTRNAKKRLVLFLFPHNQKKFLQGEFTFLLKYENVCKEVIFSSMTMP